MEEKTLRELVEALYAAKTEADRLALKAQIQGAHRTLTDVELVPNQAMPEPLVIAEWDEVHEPVGNRPQSEILDLLQDGLELSLEVLGGLEYCIRWEGQILFQVWSSETEHTEQAYDSLEALLRMEGGRPAFMLKAFTMIG